jgi:flagellar motor component MotA
MVIVSMAIFLVGIICAILFSGGSILSFVDIPSIVIMLIVPILVLLVIFKKNTKISFLIPFNKNNSKETLLYGELVFKTYSKILWILSIVIIFIGLVSILKNLEDKTMLGPNMALAMISIIYAGLLNLIITVPYLVIIKKNILEMNIENK